MAFTIERALRWWVRDKPDALAIYFDGEELSFSETFAWASRVSQWLKEEGVEKDDRVSIVAANSMEYAILLIGTMFAGAIGSPISFRSSARDLRKSLDVLEPTLVFSDAERDKCVRDALGDGEAGKRRDLSTIRSLRHAPTPPIPDFEAQTEDALFIINTSGSTGFPKGVIYGQGATMIYAAEFTVMQPATGHGGGALVTGPFSSASGTLLLFQFLAVGASVYFEAKFTPEGALQLLRNHPISTFLASTIFFERIAALPEFEQADLSSLAFAQISGARVNPNLITRYREKGVILRQAYGCTEAGGAWAARDETAISDPEKCGPGAMFSQFKVIREDGSTAPANESGEILIRSDGLAIGYWNDAEQTNKTFRDGWLHTGDRGVMDERGNLTFIDRIKDIIISGGLNVSAMEVEGAITEIDGIDEAVVLAAKDDKFGETPLAIVFGDTDRIDAEAIIDHCREALASYKVPSYVAIAPEPMPRLPSGKLDKVSLREKYANATSYLKKLR